MADEPCMPLLPSNIRFEFYKHTSLQVVQDIRQLIMSPLWQRKWGEDVANKILKWRYCDLKAGETMLAYDGDRPVAMIASYTRPYVIDHKVVRLREASDWFCLPEYRHLGLGVQLMYNLMDEPEPLFVIGVNENAQAVL